MSGLAIFGLSVGACAGCLFAYGLVAGYRYEKRVRSWVAERERQDEAINAAVTALSALRDFYEQQPYMDVEHCPVTPDALDTVADLEELMALPAVPPPHELH